MYHKVIGPSLHFFIVAIVNIFLTSVLFYPFSEKATESLDDAADFQRSTTVKEEVDNIRKKIATTK